jgi:3-oxoacyl-[acyl-carrier protein] reductase
MKLLEGKVAIITGASRGIGKGEVFAKHGANVALHTVHL